MSSGPNAATPQIPGVDLIEVIGSGGSGVVYRGHQRAFGRDVAVKVVRNVDEAEGGGATSRWEREVAAVGRLSNHPNIVPVFDAGITDDGSPYIVMPHVPKGSLGDRLRQEGALSPGEVASIGARLADALATVHAAGVLHRDVKPDNVLWSPHGEPQLTDFGIARLEDLTTTSEGALQATISYAAPEVLAGQPATESSDIYGLGATLYACLTGASPHPSTGNENVAALVARVLEEDPPSLRDRVPAGLAAVVDRAMARKPTDRHPDATHLRHDLERASDAPAAALPHEATTRLDPATLAGTAAVPAAEAPRTGMVVPAPLPAPGPPASERRERRERPVPAASGGDNRVLWGAIAIVLVLAGGLLLGAMMSDGDGEDDGADTATVDTTETTAEPVTADTSTPEPAPPSTDPLTTTEAPTTTERRGGGQDEDDEDEDQGQGRSSATAGDPGGTAVTYLQTLDRDQLDAAWAMTSERFQSSQDRGSWEDFWGGHDVRIVGEPRVERGGSVVIVPLTYDGSREDYRLELVRSGDRWLIDGPVGD